MEFANSLWEQGVPVGPGGLAVQIFSMSERLADAKALKVGVKPFTELSISTIHLVFIKGTHIVHLGLSITLILYALWRNSLIYQNIRRLGPEVVLKRKY